MRMRVCSAYAWRSFGSLCFKIWIGPRVFIGSQPPGLEQVALARVNADTIWLHISGRVMLDGGCASNRPLFGIERWTDSGWVERVPMRDVQMDRGMPWADWRDHEVMLPTLRWWIGANQPAATRELKPGMYRVVLMGANRERMWTEAFEVR
jgi:hypothetical protein